MSGKSKRKTFIALTVMGILAAIGILNRQTLAHLGPVPMVLGIVVFVGVIVAYLMMTRAGQETRQDYYEGAGQVARDAKQAAEHIKEEAEKAVEKGREWIDRRN